LLANSSTSSLNFFSSSPSSNLTMDPSSTAMSRRIMLARSSEKSVS
jgi:hypothetical protein